MLLESEFEHRDALIKQAFEEFTALGYDNASINRVLSQVGMSKGQFYYHFASKSELYLALVELAIARKGEWVRGRRMGDPGDFFETLRQQMLASVAFAEADPEVDEFVASILAERGRPIYDMVVERVGFRPGAGLGHLLEAAHARGEFREGFTLEFVQRLLPSVINSLPDVLDLRESRALATEVELFLEFLAHGLRPAEEKRNEAAAPHQAQPADRDTGRS